MSRAFIKVGSYFNGRYFGAVKQVDTIQAHLKYIGFRSRERDPEDRGFFNARNDVADWRKFYEGIRDHRALQHSSTVKAHKMIFSLREKDYEIYKLSGQDFKDIVRKVLNEYEKRKGIQLDWIAVKHDMNSHPHCHVVVRAVSESKNNEPSKRVFFNKEDIQMMKRDFDLELSKHRSLEHEREVQQREPGFEMRDLFMTITKSIEQQVKKMQHQREYEKELEQRKRDRSRGR